MVISRGVEGQSCSVTYNAGTEDESGCSDIDRVRQLDTILIVNNSVFCKEPVRSEALQKRLAGHAVPSEISLAALTTRKRLRTDYVSYIPRTLEK